MGAVSEEEFGQQSDQATDQATDQDQSGENFSSNKVKVRHKSLMKIYSENFNYRKFGMTGFVLIGILLFSEIFFVGLLLLSYFSSTKDVVAKIMTYMN